ncbi:hemicentin-1 isoform X2 [Oreochromis niloticus]|uniref:hemicentin-1 isoform X2 n=1 Tax=Oreochromis niloticus TaxID=8128 RepID=UPI0009058C2D|nr:hemicentin-1 isoform X2 [Oreochromis niloticus]
MKDWSLDQKIIKAESGQRVTLTCRAQNNKIKFVHWSRADLEPDYFILYRDGELLSDNQHPSFKNRVDLQDRQMKDGDVSLILKDVTTADDGTYKCHVFVEETRSWELISIINLNVFPDEQIITAESGQHITLTCRAPNNKIKFVHWSRADLEPEYLLVFRDGQSLLNNQHPSFKNRVDLLDKQMKDGDVSLILEDVTLNDDGTYKCRVFMEETRSWKLSIIKVTVSSDKKIITAESGQSVTLTCQAPNNKIKFVHWSRADLEPEYVLFYRDGQLLPDDQHPFFKNRVDLQDRQMKDGDVSLILKDVTTADDGTYQCRIFTEETRSWKSVSIINLNVPPDQKNIMAESGQDVTLPCHASNNKVKFVHWSRADLEPEYLFIYRDEQFLLDKKHSSFKNSVDLQDRQMKDGDVSLILKEVTSADNGTYMCRVFMDEIRSWKLSIINLSVPPDQRNITALSRKSVILPCGAPSNSKVKFIYWSRADLEPEYLLVVRDGQALLDTQHPSFKNRVDLQDIQMKDGDVSLILNNVNTADDGTYQCHIFMEETRSWKLSIIYLSVPLIHKDATAESGQNVTLTCRAPNNNIDVLEWSRADLDTEYVLLYRDEQFDTDNQHPSFKNRVDLQDRQMKDGDVSLILKDVTINDAGTYECRIFMRGTNHKDSKPISSVTLGVVPPDQKNITAESGQDVSLTCRAPNKNIKFVHWSRADLKTEYVLVYRDERLFTDHQHPSFKDRVDLKDRQMKDGDVSLILKLVTSVDDGTYKCRVFMEETRSWKHSIINLTVPPDQKSITAESGQDVTLTCRAPNNNKGVKWSRADLKTEYVLWYQDHHFVPDNQHPSFKNRVDLQDRQMKYGDVSLILKDVTINDTGTYECRIFMRGTNNKDSKPISRVTLTVVVPPGHTGGSVGLIVGLSVSAVLLVAAVAGFLIYKKNYQQNRDFN